MSFPFHRNICALWMIHRGVEMKIESITVATTLQLWISHYVARETQFPKCGKTTENVAISNDST